jgi:dihydroflavonol-4-reductase
MPTVLLTGATSFLGYHVAKRLNQQGIRPRVLELRGSPDAALHSLDVERCAGDLEDAPSIEAACTGADTLVHTAFKVSVGGGAALVEQMRRINVAGTERLLDAAAAHGITRAVVTGSALAVGVNRRAQPLDEDADAVEHALALPYATIRGEAERASLARARPTFAVMSVAPSFTLGPDDPVGAPANKLVKAVMAGKIPVTLTVGFGCLDVRDFATGALLAAERGRSGRRYLLSGENVTTAQFLSLAAGIAGGKAPRFEPPTFLVKGLVAAIEGWSAIRGKPAPVTRDVLQIIGRYAWYNASRAHTELGWTSRPLRDTLTDTIRWLAEGTKNEERRTKNGTQN